MKNNIFKPIQLFIFLFLISCGNLIAQDIPEIDEKFLEQYKDMARQREELSRLKLVQEGYYKANRKEIINLIDKSPSFSMFHDNYFITGVPTNKKISKSTADAKFQVSIRQRLTKTVLPYETFLFLTYTQKSFWNIYENSSPFYDNNYNPGLSLGTPLIHQERLLGMLIIGVEHESNGKDSIDSRSWNYLAISGSYFFNLHLSGQAKVWPAYIDGGENKDLYKYRGYGLIALNYRTLNDKFVGSFVITPRDRFRSYNTTLELNYRVSKSANQYIFLQWYNGYGESLLDYNQYTSMVRVGICMKPPMNLF